MSEIQKKNKDILAGVWLLFTLAMGIGVIYSAKHIDISKMFNLLVILPIAMECLFTFFLKKFFSKKEVKIFYVILIVLYSVLFLLYLKAVFGCNAFLASKESELTYGNHGFVTSTSILMNHTACGITYRLFRGIIFLGGLMFLSSLLLFFTEKDNFERKKIHRIAKYFLMMFLFILLLLSVLIFIL